MAGVAGGAGAMGAGGAKGVVETNPWSGNVFWSTMGEGPGGTRLG